jgi:hypothetical protein
MIFFTTTTYASKNPRRKKEKSTRFPTIHKSQKALVHPLLQNRELAQSLP